MISVRRHLEKLRKVKRHHYHPLIHRIHRKHKISRKTLFYVKEYGPHSNVPRTIIKESLKILLFASILSSVGGLALEQIRVLFVSIIPLVILLPVLNGMIGGYGTIVSSRFSAMLHEGRVRGAWWKNQQLKKLFVQLFVIAVIMTLLSVGVAVSISTAARYALTIDLIGKIAFIALLDVLVLVAILFLTSITAGLYFYRKGEDPNNFLIPITTSIADFGNMIVLTVLVILVF